MDSLLSLQNGRVGYNNYSPASRGLLILNSKAIASCSFGYTGFGWRVRTDQTNLH